MAVCILTQSYTQNHKPKVKLCIKPALFFLYIVLLLSKSHIEQHHWGIQLSAEHLGKKNKDNVTSTLVAL